MARRRVVLIRRGLARLGVDFSARVPDSGATGDTPTGPLPTSGPEPEEIVQIEPSPAEPEAVDAGESAFPDRSRWLPPELGPSDRAPGADDESGGEPGVSRWLP